MGMETELRPHSASTNCLLSPSLLSRPLTPVIHRSMAMASRLAPAEAPLPSPPLPRSRSATQLKPVSLKPVRSAATLSDRSRQPQPLPCACTGSSSSGVRPLQPRSLMRGAYITSTSSAHLSAFSSGNISVCQEVELRERAQHMQQRSMMLQRQARTRADARQRALERRETYWVRREQQEQRAALVHRVCAAALSDSITFLPRMPEAASLARATWARDGTEEASADRDEAVRQVREGLSDDTAIIAALVAGWQKPSHEKAFFGKLRDRTMDARGRAPRSLDFKKCSELAVAARLRGGDVEGNGWEEDD